MNNRIIVFLILVSLFFSGCTTTKPPKKQPPTDTSAGTDVAIHRARLGDVTENIQSNSGQIGKLGAGIVGNAEKVIQENPKIKEAITIKSDAEQILGINAETLRDTEKIKEINMTLIDAEKKIKDLNDVITDKDKKIAEFQDQALKRAKDLWLIISSFAALVFVAALCITITYSPKIGMPLMMCAVSTISVSYFMVEYMQIVAICGGVITLGVLGFLLYQAYIERKALKESIVTMEISKHKVWNRQVKKQVEEIQSATTKSLVRDTREAMKKNGYYMLPGDDGIPEEARDVDTEIIENGQQPSSSSSSCSSS